MDLETRRPPVNVLKERPLTNDVKNIYYWMGRAYASEHVARRVRDFIHSSPAVTSLNFGQLLASMSETTYFYEIVESIDLEQPNAEDQKLFENGIRNAITSFLNPTST